MKALAVFPEKRAVDLIDHPAPTIGGSTEVGMRVLDVGVCGTDREIATFQFGSPPEGSDYLIIGHESLSEVTEVGPSVTRVKPGDLVAMTVRRPCRHASCIACRQGRQDFCFTGDFTERGIKQRHGYIAEFVVEDEQYLHPVPPRLRDVAVLVEPLSIAEKSLEQLWMIQKRLPWGCPDDSGFARGQCHNALVLGAGPIGLLGAMAFRIAGFDVSVYSRSSKDDNREEIVGAIGARYIAAEQHSVEEMAKLTGPIDVVYEAIGASSVAFEVIQHLGPNAVFIFTGLPGHKGRMELDTDAIMRDMVLNNQAIIGTVNAPPQAFEAAIAHLAVFTQRWPDALRKVITARFPIGRALDALSPHAGGIKNVVQVAS